MANFKWLRNPTLSNSKTTRYVSHRGNDTTGDGSATNPYKTIAKATSVATAGDNIMLDDGVWSQQRTLNSRAFNWWGNGMTWIKKDTIEFSGYNNDEFNYLKITGDLGRFTAPYFNHCYCENINVYSLSSVSAKYCILKNQHVFYRTNDNRPLENNILINCRETQPLSESLAIFRNNIIIGGTLTMSHPYADYNNYTTGTIPTTNGGNSHSINDASTEQTVADYFNNAALGDYTAKAGSANLGAGYNKHDIGFSQGFTCYANNSMFTTAGGATLTNVTFNNNCFKITQRDKAVDSATSTTLTLYTDAETSDDYYNGLIIGIVSGKGKGQMRTITDYDGATKTVTVAAWDTTPDSTSRYTISGLIITADKDFGAPFKVAMNQVFANFGYNELNPTIWTELMAINPLVASFGIKFSDFNDLSTKSWFYMGANGKTLSDGTYGDADNSHTIASGKPIHMRYVKLQIPLIFAFES